MVVINSIPCGSVLLSPSLSMKFVTKLELFLWFMTYLPLPAINLYISSKRTTKNINGCLTFQPNKSCKNARNWVKCPCRRNRTVFRSGWGVFRFWFYQKIKHQPLQRSSLNFGTRVGRRRSWVWILSEWCGILPPWSAPTPSWTCPERGLGPHSQPALVITTSARLPHL